MTTMEIPNELIWEAGIGIITVVGTALSILTRQLILEIRRLRSQVESVGSVMAKISMIVSTCKHCPHPDFRLSDSMSKPAEVEQ